ncbi:four helix bundle protein [Patescibacteria group bacterium]|nr:four helix bundle protein [Patescibacteria group bacterium]
MKDFRRLNVWQKAHEMALSVYKATLSFPREEMYGLVSQLRRAASSVPANINETEYHLLLGRELGYLHIETYQVLNEQVTEVKRMLTGFIRKLMTERLPTGVP